MEYESNKKYIKNTPLKRRDDDQNEQQKSYSISSQKNSIEEKLQSGNTEQQVLIVLTGGTIGMFESSSGLQNQQGSFLQFLKENPYFCDQDYTFYNKDESQDFLITPLTPYQKRIKFTLHEFSQLIDSSQMQHQNYIQIAQYIEQYYEQFDSFIILHGTDTLAYTASMLSFMLENLQKTIIITGSQIPISFLRNDAFNNLLCSLTIAGHFTIPQVLVVFHNKLFRGQILINFLILIKISFRNRCKKSNATAIEAFSSPNFEPLAQFGINIDVKWNLIYKSNINQPFRVQKKLCEFISVIKFNPMMSDDFLESVFSNKNAKAIILESYGTGNIPSQRFQLIELIQLAVERGVVVVNISQCFHSKVEGIYEAGKILVDLGVVFCSDITSEAALCKLSYLLGQKEEFPQENIDIKKLMNESIRGEMTLIDVKSSEDGYHHFLSQTMAQVFSTQEEKQELQNLMLEPIIQYNIIHFNITELEELLPIYTDIGQQDYDERTILHLAVSNTNYIEESGSPVHQNKVKNHEAQLHICKLVLEKLKECLSQNDNEQNNKLDQDQYFSPIDNNGLTPLAQAVLLIDFQLIKLLMQYGCQLRPNLQHIITQIHERIQTLEIVRFLECLRLAGFDAWKQILTIDDRNLAHLGYSLDSVELVTFLQQIGFKFNSQDKFNKFPFDYNNPDGQCSEAQKIGNDNLKKILQFQGLNDGVSQQIKL